MKNFISLSILSSSILFTGLLLAPSGFIWAEEASKEKSMSLDDLLREIKSEERSQSVENQAREKKFMSKKSEQQKLLRLAQNQLKEEDAISAQLNKKFESNEKILSKMETDLNLALGTLGELFGVVRQVSGDLKGVFQTSIISSQISGREKFVGRLAETKALPEIKDLENLWFEMQREMTESGRVSKFKGTVTLPNGKKTEKVISRVGSFNLISDGAYLVYQPETGELTELPRQPSGRWTSLIGSFESSKRPYEAFAVDPSRGSILSMLVQAPSFFERIQQGGLVGYVILFLLIIGLAIVAERVVYLQREDERIKLQLERFFAQHWKCIGATHKGF